MYVVLVWLVVLEPGWVKPGACKLIIVSLVTSFHVMMS